MAVVAAAKQKRQYVINMIRRSGKSMVHVKVGWCLYCKLAGVLACICLMRL